MPEYLAPGVYVEEVSFRSKSIEGVSTTTTGFVGPARSGPVDELEPDIITSLGEFERVYGDGQQLVFEGGVQLHNYLWHAVRAFFEEGGKRLYVARVFLEGTGDGKAAWSAGVTAANPLLIKARFPGFAGNRRVNFKLVIGQNVLADENGTAVVKGLQNDDVVWIGQASTGSPPDHYDGEYYRAQSHFDLATRATTWSFRSRAGTSLTLDGSTAPPSIGLSPGSDQVRVVKLTVTVFPSDPTNPRTVPEVWENLALHPTHQLFGTPDAVTAFFADDPDVLPNRALGRVLPITIKLSPDGDGLAILAALAAASNGSVGATQWSGADGFAASFDIQLDGGNDGARPTATEYEGSADETTTKKSGLKALEDIEDISIVAAPGSTFGGGVDGVAIMGLLIAHASRMRYRIAVLDSVNGQAVADVRDLRAKLDSTYAALYYPWVRVLDPITRKEIYLPPSGFVAGIYARNDVNRAVYKAPANEVVNLALGFETLLNKAQQEVLNPEGINCFRFFEGRGFRLWGARTISSDPEWKYVNLRRYFAYLERSIDKGTQWAVFEPNGEALWANVRRTIDDFLLNEWMSGALLGDKPEKAYFVRCDRSTMTQNDLDNGRLICLIGVAPLRPAEFVIFRIGQWTADRKV